MNDYRFGISPWQFFLRLRPQVLLAHLTGPVAAQGEVGRDVADAQPFGKWRGHGGEHGSGRIGWGGEW